MAKVHNNEKSQLQQKNFLHQRIWVNLFSDQYNMYIQIYSVKSNNWLDKSIQTKKYNRITNTSQSHYTLNQERYMWTSRVILKQLGSCSLIYSASSMVDSNPLFFTFFNDIALITNSTFIWSISDSRWYIQQ